MGYVKSNDAARLFCTSCQQWQFSDYSMRCNCGKPDNSSEPSVRYLNAYHASLTARWDRVCKVADMWPSTIPLRG